jgi:hypothetical protein
LTADEDSVLIDGEIEKQVPGGKLNWFFLGLAWLLFWPVVLVNRLFSAIFSSANKRKREKRLDCSMCECLGCQKIETKK